MQFFDLLSVQKLGKIIYLSGAFRIQWQQHRGQGPPYPLSPQKIGRATIHPPEILESMPPVSLPPPPPPPLFLPSGFAPLVLGCSHEILLPPPTKLNYLQCGVHFHGQFELHAQSRRHRPKLPQMSCLSRTKDTCSCRRTIPYFPKEIEIVFYDSATSASCAFHYGFTKVLSVSFYFLPCQFIIN